ncbi:MAG: protease modulator HflC [Steroidobacter sp.]
MNMRSAVLSIVVTVAVLALVFFECTFTVDEGQFAVKVSGSGTVERTNYQPGLQFMIPLVDRIYKFDKRIMTHDYPEERFQTSDNQLLRADYFITWQIIDVAAFYAATRGNENLVEQRLGDSTRNAIREMVAKRSLQEVMAADRNEYKAELSDVVAAGAQPLGTRLLDVRIHKIGLPENYNEAVFSSMQSGFRQRAVQLRAKGEADARELTAQAERERVEILANAERDAAVIRGEGDASAAAIYANAYGRNAEFYSFYRSLQAYRATLGKQDDVLVISPDGDFFKYLNKSAAH